MAPYKQPKRLLLNCLHNLSNYLLNNFMQKTYPNDTNFKGKWRIEFQEKLPPSLLNDLMHTMLHEMSKNYETLASVEIVKDILFVCLQNKITRLSLSDLAYIGEVDWESLDSLEHLVVSQMPLLHNLTVLDLSTNHYHMTWPSCSLEMLKAIGTYCTNLKSLDLTNNNRVTFDGLLWLIPKEMHPGCAQLEELFVQDCSIDAYHIAYILCCLPQLAIVGYPEIGQALLLIQKNKGLFGLYERVSFTLNLRTIDNTASHSAQADTIIIKLIPKTCPNIEALKVRVSDDDVKHLLGLVTLKTLELRFMTGGTHHVIGPVTAHYLYSNGRLLTCLTLYCDELTNNQVISVASQCTNLSKLFLHANSFTMDDSPLETVPNCLTQLQILSIRIGQDELVMTPAGCDLLKYFLYSCTQLQEVYILLRCELLNNEFITHFTQMNGVQYLKTFVCDAQRRTLAAPMMDLTVDTALHLIQNCPKLQLLGNFISWNMNKKEVDMLKNFIIEKNYDVTIISTQSNKRNTKYF